MAPEAPLVTHHCGVSLKEGRGVLEHMASSGKDFRRSRTCPFDKEEDAARGAMVRGDHPIVWATPH